MFELCSIVQDSGEGSLSYRTAPNYWFLEAVCWNLYMSELQIWASTHTSLVSVQFTFLHSFFWCLSSLFSIPELFPCVSYWGGISPCPGPWAPRQSSRHQLMQSSSPCVNSYLRACHRATLELLVTCAQIIPVKWLNSAVHAGAVLVNKCMGARSSNCTKDSLNVSSMCKYLGSFKC